MTSTSPNKYKSIHEQDVEHQDRHMRFKRTLMASSRGYMLRRVIYRGVDPPGLSNLPLATLFELENILRAARGRSFVLEQAARPITT